MREEGSVGGWDGGRKITVGQRGMKRKQGGRHVGESMT